MRLSQHFLAYYEEPDTDEDKSQSHSPTAFSKYCYVEVVLAAGTLHMTPHRPHAFISYAEHTTWDFLVGTGPMKNALRITLDLGPVSGSCHLRGPFAAGDEGQGAASPLGAHTFC